MLPNRKQSSTLFTAAILALSVPHASQALSFGAGPLGGLNLGNAAVEDHDDTDARTGIAVGGRAEFGVSSPYSLMVEATYVQKGARFAVSAGPFGDIDAEGDLDYLEIPLLVKAKFGAPNAHAYVFAGPAMAFNLSAEGKFGSLSDTFKDEAANLEFAGQVGAGAAFKVAEFVFLTGDARYSHGLSDALEKPVGDIDDWMSRDIRFMAGLLIHLTR
jgi:hypothetical protein